MYHHRFVSAARDTYLACGRNLVAAFGKFQERRLAGNHHQRRHPRRCCRCWPATRPPSAPRSSSPRDHYRSCFGRDPRGIWLPECAYADGVEHVLAGSRTSAGSSSTPTACSTPGRVRATASSPRSSPRTAWPPSAATSIPPGRSGARHEGYPGDPRYRDFYRDIGFDLDLDYVKPYLPGGRHSRVSPASNITRITGARPADKQIYDRAPRSQAAAEHAGHFLDARIDADPTPGRHHGSPAAAWSRPTTPNCSGTGGMRGRSSSISSCARPVYDQKSFTLITPWEYLAGQSRPAGRPAQPLQLGRGRLLARSGSTRPTMDLPPPARRPGTDDATGPATYPAPTGTISAP